MADQIRFTPIQVFDANGDPAAGAKAYFYQTGTTTPLTTYADEGLTTAHAVPLVADAQGVFAAVFVSASVKAKVDVTDAADVRLNGYPIDPATIHTGGAGASTISFSATAENPNTNVQDAIEHASELVNDETPQLGGDLDANGKNIGFDNGSGITDDAGNETLTFGKTASAVNGVKLSNAATGNGPTIEATGDDTNIDLNLKPKGDGVVAVDGAVSLGGAVTETVYNLTGTDIDPANGTIQYKTLSANTTLTESLSDGQSVTLAIDDGTAYAITWPTITWISDGGSAPTLATTGYTWIVIWQMGATLYGTKVS